jgi:hypothetical protein
MNFYSLISFGSNPTIHFQDHDDTTALCEPDGGSGLAISHMPLDGIIEYAPHEIAILALTGVLDGALVCHDCSDVVTAKLQLEDDLYVLEHTS